MGSNLPPGVTPGDIDRHYGGGHEHEFEEPNREVFEDGVFIVITQCNHAPIENSWTDGARDETYTKHGPRCEAEKHMRLDASRLGVLEEGGKQWHTVAESDDNVFHDAYADDTTFSFGVPRDVEAEVADAICDEGVTVARHDAGDVTVHCEYHERVVHIDGTVFSHLPNRQIRITYDNVAEEIRQ